MPASAPTKKKSTSDHKPGDPDMNDRAASGLKAAEHIQKAMAGGKIRKAFSLWRASSHLSTAAAGTGDVVKRHPLAAALVGGTVAAVAIYCVARSAGAQEEEGQEDGDTASQGEDAEGEGKGEAEGRMHGDGADAQNGDGHDADEESGPAPKRSGSKARRSS